MIGHPRERRLLGFHDGRLDDRERRRIATHLAGCQACRNTVQGHRAVRSVFQLEAPPAPGGVLERALETRAGGGVLVLPAADPSGRRRVPTGALALVAGVAALLLLTVVQVVPLRPLGDAWQWWSRTVVAWRPFGGGGPGSGPTIRLPALLRAPVAARPVVHPERLRPLTAIYRSSRTVRGQAKVDTAGFRLEPPAAGEHGWLLVSDIHGTEPTIRPIELHPVTLEPFRWMRLSNRRAGVDQYQSYVLRDRQVERTRSYHPDPPASWLEREPVGTDRFTIDLDADALIVGSQWQLYAVLGAVEITKGWAGAFMRMWGNPAPGSQSGYVFSLFEDGGEAVTTPAGTFDTWRLHELQDFGPSNETLWVRKSDGLLVKWQKSGYGDAFVTELLSVTYP